RDEALDALGREIAGGREGDALVLDDAHAERSVRGLLHQLGLAEAHLGGQLGAGSRDGLGHVRAALAGSIDDGGGEVGERRDFLSHAIVHRSGGWPRRRGGATTAKWLRLAGIWVVCAPPIRLAAEPPRSSLPTGPREARRAALLRLDVRTK